METTGDISHHGLDRIDPEVFFDHFLAADPKYGAIGPILDRLRLEIARLLGNGSLSFSEFVDMMSIEYDQDGEILPKDDEILKALAKAMKQVDVTREALKFAASAGLTSDQIAEGPTCLKVPVALLRSETAFSRFVGSLSREYRGCEDYPALIRSVYALKVHQKPLFLLFDQEARIVAYCSPTWSMQEMREPILSRSNKVAMDIYNRKSPIEQICALVREIPDGHVKVIYLGKNESRAHHGHPVQPGIPG